jgi:hypothetical protein
MINNIHCQNKSIDSFFMETKVKEPLYIGGVPTYDLYLEKYPYEGYLYINGVRAKELPAGANYQIIEPKLFEYFDEICEVFDGDDVDIVIDNKSYLPLSIQVDGKYILTIEFSANSAKMITTLSLNEIRQMRTRFENVFRNKIIPLLKKVGLYD